MHRIAIGIGHAAKRSSQDEKNETNLRLVDGFLGFHDSSIAADIGIGRIR